MQEFNSISQNRQNIFFIVLRQADESCKRPVGFPFARKLMPSSDGRRNDPPAQWF